jgi:hypothetical protein
MSDASLVDRGYSSLSDPFARLYTKRRGTKLLRAGEQSEARLDGIEVTKTSTGDGGGISGYTWAMAVTVTPRDAPPFKAGLRQQLIPDRGCGGVHIGASLLVRHDGRRVVIDWPAMLDRFGLDAPWDTPDGWRPLRTPPPDGVDDHQVSGRRARKRLAEWTRGSATVVGLEPVETAFGSAMPRVILRVGDATATVKLHEWPEYARHLVVPGTDLPVAVNPARADEIEVDWIAAGEAPRESGPLPDLTA